MLDNILTTLDGDGELDQEYEDKKDKPGISSMYISCLL